MEAQLNGFEERFRIVGRESLADALRERLNALETHRRNWTPDILRFFLELSDQPTRKSKLSDLDLLIETKSDDGPKLTWEEIAKEDGWYEDRATWRNIEYSPDSDEEQLATSDDESLTTDSSAPEEYQRTADDLVPQPGNGALLLATCRESQAWRFAARRGDRLLIEVEGSRLGSPIPPATSQMYSVSAPQPLAW